MTQVVLTETHGKVGLIRINRPEAMNALNNDVVDGIGAAIDAFEPTTTSAASSSPATRRPSPRAPTSAS